MHSASFDDHGSLVRWTEIDGDLPARGFIHGLGGTGEAILGGVARHPAIAGHRSILVDLPGHGASDRPADYSYTLDAHAEAVVAVCRAAGIDGIDIVGHSLGADIAIVIAARNPGLVRRLVISEANLDPLPASLTGRGSQAIRAQTEDAFVQLGYQALMDGDESWARTLRFADARAIHRSAVGLTTGTTPTMRAMFVRLSIPRTFIKGDRGEPLLDEAGLEAAGVRVVTIPDAGHMVMFDNPPAFTTALAAALART
jgi:pimeloyl-ACP methyl ester carboxylesterase